MGWGGGPRVHPSVTSPLDLFLNPRLFCCCCCCSVPGRSCACMIYLLDALVLPAARSFLRCGGERKREEIQQDKKRGGEKGGRGRAGKGREAGGNRRLLLTVCTKLVALGLRHFVLYTAYLAARILAGSLFFRASRSGVAAFCARAMIRVLSWVDRSLWRGPA